MESFEVSVEHERFRISERRQPDGRLSYDFAWLNGPAEGSYGFTIARSGGEDAPGDPGGASRISREELVAEVGYFVTSFYSEGGSGALDFPEHAPAQGRGRGQ